MHDDHNNGRFVIALAGNPNAGKTTLFNSLTGLKQKVANYPGVTVERKEGSWRLGQSTADLIDLPGLYSLDATSLDEQIARQVITGEQKGLRKPDAIVAVVDATNLERNLYLVTQIFEFGIPVVVALTMIDVFEKQKHEIDIEKLERLLNVPVIPVNAKSSRGKDELAKRVIEVIEQKPRIPIELNGRLEGEPQHVKIFARYNFISNVVQESVKHNDKEDHRFSEKIDRVLTHKFFGLVILVGVLLLVFQAIFSWASLPMDLLDQGFGLAEIAGNHEILITVIAPDAAKLDIKGTTELFSLALDARPGFRRAGLKARIDRLVDISRDLKAKGASIEHFYDY